MTPLVFISFFFSIFNDGNSCICGGTAAAKCGNAAGKFMYMRQCRGQVHVHVAPRGIAANVFAALPQMCSRHCRKCVRGIAARGIALFFFRGIIAANVSRHLSLEKCWMHAAMPLQRKGGNAAKKRGRQWRIALNSSAQCHGICWQQRVSKKLALYLR